MPDLQIQISLLSWGPEQQTLKSICDDLGITVIAYSPLALGLLSGEPWCPEGRERSGIGYGIGPYIVMFCGCGRKRWQGNMHSTTIKTIRGLHAACSVGGLVHPAVTHCHHAVQI